MTSSSLVLWLVGTFFLLLSFNHFVPDPYMDEIFHIPQTKRWCDSIHSVLQLNADWDPKITTPPGIYLSHIALFKPIDYVLSPFRICGTPLYTRITNFFWWCFLMFSLSNIQIQEFTILKGSSINLKPPSMTIFGFYPLVYFFVFLFYTDIASLACVIYMFESTLLCLQNQTPLIVPSIFAFLSLMMRQSNIIWILFCIGTSILSGFSKQPFLPLKFPKHVGGSDSKHYIAENFTNFIVNMRRSFYCLKQGLEQSIPLFLPVIFFSHFVYVNGSIALGDQDAHQLSFHFAQMNYLVIVLCGSLLLFSQKPFHLSTFLYSLPITILLSHIFYYYGTIAHPYILSDNRHYSFTFFRLLHNRLNYFVLITLTGFCWSFLFFWLFIHPPRIFSKKTHPVILSLWKIGFLITVFVSVVSSPLIEFRYFIIPMFFFHRFSFLSSKYYFLQKFIYIFVSLVLLGIFVFYPFIWGDGSLARLMF